MKKIYFILKQILSLIAIVTSSCYSYSQTNELGIKIVSGSRTIYNDPGTIKQIANEFYFQKVEELTAKTLAILKAGIKSASDQSSRREEITLSSMPIMEIRQEENKSIIKYSLPGNLIAFRVTTPDIPIIGIGTDRGLDPSFAITYDISIEFEIINSGILENLNSKNPILKFNFDKVYANGNMLLKLDVWDYSGQDKVIKDVVSWLKNNFKDAIRPIYYSLNEINNKLNLSLEEKVKKSPALNEELSIDENREISVATDEANNMLLIKHSYSQKGIVKRAATKNASEVLNDPAFKTNKIPVTTSATEVNKAPASVNKSANSINKSIKKN